MQRVAIVSNSLSGGGAEYSAELLYEELRALSLPILWIGINTENPRGVAENNTKICLLRDKNKGLISTVQVFVRFAKMIYRNRISTLIVNCELPELYAAFVPKKLNLIIVEHANPSWFKRETLGRVVRTLLKMRRSKFVVVSKHLAPRFIKDKAFEVIPNPLPSQSIKFRPQVSSEVRRLLYVGRLSPDFKNPHKVLELGKKTKIPTAFVGTGPLQRELEASAKELKVDAHFFGYQQFPWNFCQDGDLLIIPSSAEGDGLVLIEAIVRGIPFLATDIPDLNRYGISALNYCENFDTFIKRIEEHRYQLDKLIVPEGIVRGIIDERSLSLIAEKWKTLLVSLETY